MSVLRLPSLFTDHMVIQRERPAPLWGWASPGVEVRASIAGCVSAPVRAGADGRFALALPVLHAGGPHTLTVSASDGAERVIADVLVGEVWLCSGQSNMEWPASISGYSAAEIARGGPSQLRLFRVPQTFARATRDDVDARWTPAGGANLGPFSGVGYAFACDLIGALGVPVGLVQSAWGGTAAEWWTPEAALDADPELRPIMERVRAAGEPAAEGTPEHAAAMEKWQRESFHQDPGNAGEGKGWAKPGIAEDAWSTMRLPQYWEDAGLMIDGAVWFRRMVEIPRAWLGKELTLSLGPVDDFDITYVNGVKVGGIGKETADSYRVARSYTVPAALTGSATLTIAVRVFDHMGNGGIYGDPELMRIHPIGRQSEAIPLHGDWRYRIELELAPKPWVPPPPTLESHMFPGRLWNGMLRPLAPYALRGVIWYQGESNADRAEQYRALMRTMITCWRQAWDAELPFYQVQLAPFMGRESKPKDSAWAELRESQELLERDLPQVDCAVIIDSGDSADIHPRNKALVGRRLARIALAKQHGRVVEHSGPRLVGHEIAKDAIRLRFAHCDGGLCASGGAPVAGFAIAGEDRRFVWATAVIDADTVTVSAPEVPKPVAVRYAWADHPVANLVNQDGLPGRPFRTDRWPGITAGKR